MFVKTFVAAASALFFLTPAMAATCTRNYTVAAGDICDGISRAYNVSTFQLAALNADKIDALCQHMQIGENLCLGTEGQDCTSVHVVSSGDSCATIQQTYQINSTILMSNNPNVDDECDNLYSGLVLCVAPTVVAPPIPPGFFDNDGSIEWVPTPDDQITEEDGDVPYCDEVMDV